MGTKERNWEKDRKLKKAGERKIACVDIAFIIHARKSDKRIRRNRHRRSEKLFLNSFRDVAKLSKKNREILIGISRQIVVQCLVHLDIEKQTTTLDFQFSVLKSFIIA
jgi:hypothetical protein